MKNTSKLFSYLLLFLFAESIALAFMYNTFLEAFIIGLPAALIPIWLYKTASDSVLSKHVTAIALIVFAGLHIHQTNGLIEVHFELFILMATLIAVSEAKVFITALVVIAIHHLAFYFMQTSGMPVFIFDEDRLAFTTVFIHAAYAIVEAIIAGYIACLLCKESVVGNELSSCSESIMVNPNKIDLSPRVNEKENSILTSFNDLLALLSGVILSVKKQVVELENNVVSFNSVKDNLQSSANSRQGEINVIATSAEEMAVTVSSISEDTKSLSEQMKDANQLSQRAFTEINYVTEKIMNSLKF